MNCKNCSHCFFCFNLKDKNYCVNNIQYTVEEYYRLFIDYIEPATKEKPHKHGLY